ncbi:hypothetical protein GOP47_0008432 [Adiantum capillus-veneris]|uniref:SAWADEE domain-containing protein n=1 Tax=Adiantum capillus-veneris TaxID=13818 RepID=A0A9D4UZ25_ADICA|nr:hypothetical protein GOP47_0008432 [Adiantum capillus-veneris]
MGRPPSGEMRVFRFLPNEVNKLLSLWEDCKISGPPNEVLQDLVEKFSKAREQDGKGCVNRRQVLQWFQNRRWYVRKQAEKQLGRLSDKESFSERTQTTITPLSDDLDVATPTTPPSDEIDMSTVEFEAKSSKDGAWYDVRTFLEHRMLDSGPEVRVRFAGYGPEDDEWVDVRSAVRQRSLACEESDCTSIFRGDMVLCFLEGTKQALFYDAYVIDIERRKHDIRGCRCRFLVQYEHNGSMGILPLRKLCRRPEHEYADTQPVDNASTAMATNTSK